VLQAQGAEPTPDVTAVEEELLVAESDVPAPPPARGDDSQGAVGQTLPQTGGYSDLQLMAGLVMFGGGLAAVFASRRKSLA